MRVVQALFVTLTPSLPVAEPPAGGLPTGLRLTLVGLLVLSAAIWIGGMVAVTMLTLSAGKVLHSQQRVSLLRDFGHRYFAVAGTALAVTVISGGVLLAARPWDGVATGIVVVSAVLVITLAIGVKQARAMSRLRRAAADEADPARAAGAARSVTASGRRAVAVRALLGMLSAALFVLAILTAA